MSVEDAQYYISETRQFVDYAKFKSRPFNENVFNSFKIRMWLDYCDEYNNILSEHMSLERYCNKYNDWLREKYEETLQ